MRMNCALDARCGRMRLTTTSVRKPGTSPDSARYTSAMPPVARRPLIWYRPRRLTVSSPRDEPNSEREPPAIFPSKVQQLAYKGSSFVATNATFGGLCGRKSHISPQHHSCRHTCRDARYRCILTPLLIFI